ncbi:hypothetical protein ACHAWF_007443 [Thalassiosira exigua]
MVTTFNARLLSLADRCKPTVGSRRVQSHNQHPQRQRQTNGGLEGQGTPKISNPPYKSAMKQHRHPRQQHPSKHDAASAKRKRQREEGAYAAAVAKKSLADAGRPPISPAWSHGGSIKFHGVGIKVANDDGALVMSSREWDQVDMTADASDASVGAKRRRPNETAEDDNGVHDESVGDEREKRDDERRHVVGSSYDVSTMYALADLIQSTRRYYNFSDGENHANNGDGMLSRLDHCSDDKLSENSEGQSSWTPSVTFGGEMTLGDLNEKKGLDDDNRSDGPSLEDGSATGGEMDSTDGESCGEEGKVLTEPVAVVG